MIQILHKVKLASSSVYLLFFFLFLNFSLPETQAQKTVQFRISTVYSNVDDMDGWPNGDSDPQWDYNITDNTFGTSDGSNTELGGTNCPYSRTLNTTFYNQTFDCALPTSYTFLWRGLEDDAIGSDANTGDRTISWTSRSKYLV